MVQPTINWQSILEHIKSFNIKELSRGISLVENEAPGYEELLMSLPAREDTKIIGITGPPGAGKSTLTDSIIEILINKGKKIAVLCIDPSSPFNHGALLGDRIRMSSWYNHPSVFIRSLASRGSLGGLHPRILEITELIKAASVDYIIVETVGVGQSEVEISGLADVTVVVVVPESGDEVQTMKAGLMEIADIFVVNKADRPGADQYVRNLRQMLAPAFHSHVNEIPIIKTVAIQKSGIQELSEKIDVILKGQQKDISKRAWLLTERVYYLLQQKRMKDIHKDELQQSVKEQLNGGDFNLYRFVQQLQAPSL